MKYENLGQRILTNCRAPLPEERSLLVDTPCWLWELATCNKGYGRINIYKAGRVRAARAHIALWELVAGREVRGRYTLDHLCRNTRCVNPSHLEEVTREENTARQNAHNHPRRPQ